MKSQSSLKVLSPHIILIDIIYPSEFAKELYKIGMDLTSAGEWFKNPTGGPAWAFKIDDETRKSLQGYSYDRLELSPKAYETVYKWLEEKGILATMSAEDRYKAFMASRYDRKLQEIAEESLKPEHLDLDHLNDSPSSEKKED